MLNTYDLRQLSAEEADITLHNLEVEIALENGRISHDSYNEIKSLNAHQLEVIRELRLAANN